MIFKDFELIEMNEEQKDSALIDKCIIIATRTKEVNTLQERERTSTETDDKSTICLLKPSQTAGDVTIFVVFRFT